MNVGGCKQNTAMEPMEEIPLRNVGRIYLRGFPLCWNEKLRCYYFQVIAPERVVELLIDIREN